MTPLRPVTVGSNTAQTSSPAQRVAVAAQEFESVLLGQWLTHAESSFGTVPGSEQSDDPGASQMNEFAMQHLAAEIAKRGGVGICHIVEAGLIKSNTPPQVPAGSVQVSKLAD